MKQEKVKLDEILKFLFNSSEKVLVKLLNSMFDENFKEDEVSVTITNSEFVEDTLEILRGDMFFKIFDKANKDFEKHKIITWNFRRKIEKKMYLLIPLQLFNLRKKLHSAKKKNDINTIKELSIVARNLAEKLANESKELFDQDEILGEDFHSMLLAIQNLIEYLNRNYIDDENLEEEVNIMTKSLYDPEVEKKGIEKGYEEIVLNMLGEGLDEATISKFTKIDIQKVKEIIKKHLN